MKPGTVHSSPGIYFAVEENSGKTQLGDRLMKALRIVIASKWNPLPLNDVDEIAQHAREVEGRRDGKAGKDT